MSGAITKALLHYEDERVVPRLTPLNVAPIRHNDSFTMTPGSIVFLMNNATSYERVGDAIEWAPLTVIYQDSRGCTGSVFSLRCRYDARGDPTVKVVSAEIDNVMRLVRRPAAVEWIDPLSDRVFKTFAFEHVDRVLDNAWLLFSGGVLPSILSGNFWFPEAEERRVFQANIVHQINALYMGT